MSNLYNKTIKKLSTRGKKKKKDNYISKTDKDIDNYSICASWESYLWCINCIVSLSYATSEKNTWKWKSLGRHFELTNLLVPLRLIKLIYGNWYEFWLSYEQEFIHIHEFIHRNVLQAPTLLQRTENGIAVHCGEIDTVKERLIKKWCSSFPQRCVTQKVKMNVTDSSRHVC